MTDFWKGSGFYEIRFNGTPSGLDPRWYDSPDALQADFDAACKHKAETVYAFADYIGDARTAYALVEDGLVENLALAIRNEYNLWY